MHNMIKALTMVFTIIVAMIFLGQFVDFIDFFKSCKDSIVSKANEMFYQMNDNINNMDIEVLDDFEVPQVVNSNKK